MYFYSKLKKKIENEIIKHDHCDVLAESVSAMFEYYGFPDEIKVDFIEPCFITSGGCSFWFDDEDKTNAQYVVSHFGLADNPDPYGEGVDVICSTMNGHVKQFNRNSNDVAIGWNNKLHTPDLMIEKFASFLTELDKSILNNIMYARLLPIPVANNDTEKAQIDAVLKKLFDGEIGAITSKNIIAELNNGTKGFETINITDVNDSDKIQYLTKTRDDIMRWFYSYYGMNCQGASKLAQQSISEITGNTSSSFILPIVRYNERKKWCDEINRKFGLNVSVRFSDAWLKEWERYSQTVDMNDGVDDDETEIDEKENVENEN